MEAVEEPEEEERSIDIYPRQEFSIQSMNVTQTV